MPRPPNVPSTKFGKRLQDCRLALGMNQADLGVLAGIEVPTTAAARISRYESGTHFPDPDTLTRIAKALRVPVAYLCADNDRFAAAVLILGRLTKDKQLEAVDLLAKFERKK